MNAHDYCAARGIKINVLSGYDEQLAPGLYNIGILKYADPAHNWVFAGRTNGGDMVYLQRCPLHQAIYVELADKTLYKVSDHYQSDGERADALASLGYQMPLQTWGYEVGEQAALRIDPANPPAHMRRLSATEDLLFAIYARDPKDYGDNEPIPWLFLDAEEFDLLHEAVEVGEQSYHENVPWQIWSYPSSLNSMPGEVDPANPPTGFTLVHDHKVAP